jgi:hypothetical protein
MYLQSGWVSLLLHAINNIVSLNLYVVVLARLGSWGWLLGLVGGKGWPRCVRRCKKRQQRLELWRGNRGLEEEKRDRRH